MYEEDEDELPEIQPSIDLDPIDEDEDEDFEEELEEDETVDPDDSDYPTDKTEYDA